MGVSPHELDAQERKWNLALRTEPEGQDCSTAYVGAYVDEPVDAHTNAPSDDVPPEPNVAVARVVVPASGSAFVAPASGSAAASSGYGPHAPDAAGDVAPWHYWCYGAEFVRSIEATADAEAIAARPPPAVHIPRTLPTPPPLSERSRRGDARTRAHRQEDRRCVTVKQLGQLSPFRFHPPENARYTRCEVDTRRRQSSTWTGHFPQIEQKSNG